MSYVVEIFQNEAGQIVMKGPDSRPFDMSKYAGKKLYVGNPESEAIRDLLWDTLYEVLNRFPAESRVGDPLAHKVTKILVDTRRD